MQHFMEFLLMVVFLLGLAALGTRRLNMAIRVIAAQGIVVGLLIVVTHWNDLTPHLVLFSVFSMLVKGVGMPFLLFRSHKIANVGDVQAFVGPMISMVIATFALGVAFGFSGALPLPETVGSRLIVPISLATVFNGFVLIVTRKTAISQVLGFILLENGIFVFSLVLISALPTPVEMGILLDIFVAVFVMGITIYQIDREFDHIDASKLSALGDMPSKHKSPFGFRVRQSNGERR